jgi:hypothetical protein
MSGNTLKLIHTLRARVGNTSFDLHQRIWILKSKKLKKSKISKSFTNLRICSPHITLDGGDFGPDKKFMNQNFESPGEKSNFFRFFRNLSNNVNNMSDNMGLSPLIWIPHCAHQMDCWLGWSSDHFSSNFEAGLAMWDQTEIRSRVQMSISPRWIALLIVLIDVTKWLRTDVNRRWLIEWWCMIECKRDLAQ